MTKKAAKKILSAYLNLLTAYPDQPYEQKPVYHPLDGHPIVTPEDTVAPGTILPKDEEVLNIVERKIAAGEKVLIYTNWTRLDSQMRLQTLLTARGWNTIIMPAKVKPAKREQWVADRLSAGLQVLIANPTLVQTGLDLNAFTTLIFYDTGYKLFTLRQASRRSWRINQTAPRGRGLYVLLSGHHAAQGDQAHGLQAGCGGNYRGLVLRGGPCRHVRVRGYAASFCFSAG